jgi:hypothetical protein
LTWNMGEMACRTGWFIGGLQTKRGQDFSPGPFF